MGNSRYDAGATRLYASATATRSVDDYRQVYDAKIDKQFDPKQIKARESRSSVLNPNPTPIIVGLDGTGSMRRIVEDMRKGLGTLFKEIIDRKPVTDPHVLAMIIGDMDAYDRSPVQATEFEADPVTIGKQIENLFLEGGGGGNSFESYLGPLYFAVNKTECDAFKEGRKGYIFTVGDELPQPKLTRDKIYKFFGEQIPENIEAGEMVQQVLKDWHYFHLIAMEGDYASSRPKQVTGAWNTLLGQRAINLIDHKKMSEVIISLIEVTSGRDKESVIDSWSGDTAGVIKEAIKNVPAFPSLDI